MKARWKIIFTLLVPVLLILSGAYLKLILSTRYSRSDYEAYYIKVSRPAIESLNNDKRADQHSGDFHPLSAKDRTEAMSAMLQHGQNLQEYGRSVRRNRIFGYFLFSIWGVAILTFVTARFDKEKNEA